MNGHDRLGCSINMKRSLYCRNSGSKYSQLRLYAILRSININSTFSSGPSIVPVSCRQQYRHYIAATGTIKQQPAQYSSNRHHIVATGTTQQQTLQQQTALNSSSRHYIAAIGNIWQQQALYSSNRHYSLRTLPHQLIPPVPNDSTGTMKYQNGHPELLDRHHRGTTTCSRVVHEYVVRTLSS